MLLKRGMGNGEWEMEMGIWKKKLKKSIFFKLKIKKTN